MSLLYDCVIGKLNNKKASVTVSELYFMQFPTHPHTMVDMMTQIKMPSAIFVRELKIIYDAHYRCCCYND